MPTEHEGAIGLKCVKVSALGEIEELWLHIVDQYLILFNPVCPLDVAASGFYSSVFCLQTLFVFFMHTENMSAARL